MNYEKFNNLYKEIYEQKFIQIKHTDFEYHYLEEKHYAIREVGQIYFYIVIGKSPLDALDRLLRIGE